MKTNCCEKCELTPEDLKAGKLPKCLAWDCPCHAPKDTETAGWEKLYATLQPAIELIKSKYPVEMNIEGFELALSSDITDIVYQHTQTLREQVEGMKETGANTPTDIYRQAAYNEALTDVLALLK